MERTTCLIVNTLALERDIVTDNIYYIGSGKYSIYGFAVNHPHKDTKKYFDNITYEALYCIAIM